MRGQFKLTIDLGNEAMRTPQAVAKVVTDEMAKLAERYPSSHEEIEGTIFDDNGNRVGSWTYEVTS